MSVDPVRSRNSDKSFRISYPAGPSLPADQTAPPPDKASPAPAVAPAPEAAHPAPGADQKDSPREEHARPESIRIDHAITAILSNPTLAAAAQSLGICRTSLWKIMQRPDFRKPYHAACKEALAVAEAQVQRAAILAADALGEVIAAPDTPPATRVAAAKGVLTHILHIRQLVLTRQRVFGE